MGKGNGSVFNRFLADIECCTGMSERYLHSPGYAIVDHGIVSFQHFRSDHDIDQMTVAGIVEFIDDLFRRNDLESQVLGSSFFT